MRVFWYPGVFLVLALVAVPHRPRTIIRAQIIAVVIDDGGQGRGHGSNVPRNFRACNCCCRNLPGLHGLRAAGLCPAAVGFGRKAGGHRFPRLAGRDGRSGGRCKYVRVSSIAASMRLTPPPAHPDPPSTVRRWPMGNAQTTAALIRGHALPDVEGFTAVVCRPTLPQQIRASILIFVGHRPTVGPDWDGLEGGMRRLSFQAAGRARLYGDGAI